MKLGVLGRRKLVLLSAALAVGCAQAATAPVVPVAPVARPAAPAFTAPSAAACPFARTETLWLPGGEQLLSYCNEMLELRDAVSGSVLAQRLADTPASWRDGIQLAAVSPDGSRLALAFHRHVEVRELPGLTVRWSADISPYAMTFSTSGQQLRVSEGATTVAFSVTDGQRVTPMDAAVAKRWQDSLALNADDTLAFEIAESTLTVWDPRKDVALRSFELPKGSYAAPIWIGPYLGLRDSDDYLLVDARNPERRFPLKGASLERVVLSKDGTRLRSSQEGDLVEWRLGEATPTVLASGKPSQTWLGPEGVRVESTRTSLTVWRQSASGERVPQRVLVHAGWVDFGPAGEVVVRDRSEPRLLVLGPTGAAQELTLPTGERPNLLAFEPTGRGFVVAAGRKLQVYRRPKFDVQQTIELPFEPGLLAWRSESPELLVTDNQTLHSVALGTGKVTPVSDVLGVQRVAVSPDGKSVAVAATSDGKPALTLLGKTGSEPLALNGELADLRFSPDGKALWVLERDALLTLRVPWSTSPAEHAERRALEAAGRAVRLAPTGEVSTTGGELQPIALQPAWSAQGLVLTSDERRHAPVVVSFPAGTASLQPLPKAPPEAPGMPEMPLFSGEVRAWALNADRSVLATLDGNASVNTFSTTGGLRARLTEAAAAIIASEDANRLLVVANDERSLTLWDSQTWQPQVEWPVVERINQVAVSKDGARVAVLDDHGALQVVFADRSLHRYNLRPDMGSRGLAFDPSGQYLALGGLPLRLVRLADGAVLYGYAAHADANQPVLVAWVSEGGAYFGEDRALPQTATFAKQQTPNLLQTFFGPVAR